MTPGYADWDIGDVLDLLARLHRPKDRAYGDAWRKRGEVIAIFANVARKYDRLVVGLADPASPAFETLGETAGDLCVYGGKYLTWLAETCPNVFHSVPPRLSAKECTAHRGPEALEAVFRGLSAWRNEAQLEPPGDEGSAWDRVRSSFVPLEQGLLAQAEADAARSDQLAWPAKIGLAFGLTDASAWLLLRLGQRDRRQLDSVVVEVEGMERVCAS
jgi:hypothetical protein